MERVSKFQASTAIFLEGKHKRKICVVLRKGPDLRNCANE